MRFIEMNFKLLCLGVFLGPILMIVAFLLKKRKWLSRAVFLAGTIYFLIGSILIFNFIRGEKELSQSRLLVIPEGWETFAYAPDTSCNYKDAEGSLHISADLDADGETDSARLLRNIATKKQGLFVYLSTERRTDLVKEFEALSEISIDVLKPGEVLTVCGKGYMDCPEGTPEVLKMDNPTLQVFYCEKTDFALVWNKLTKKFSEVWLSD
jgi:hypothetical protein